MHSALLAPVIALVLWTFVMCAWLYATRIPAIRRHNIVYDPRRPSDEFHARLPAEARWKADNYANLMEQPTVFYALAAYTYLAGQQNTVNLVLAWAYVAIRVVHSVVQATVNIVLVRFSIFILGTLVLSVIAARDVAALF